MELVCIVCPRGCRMLVDDGKVSGNACKKGEAFAYAEQNCPTRTVCTTVATAFKEIPVLPVRTDGEIPKAKIFEFMEIINKIKLDKKVKRGDVILKNVMDTGINVVATATVW